MNLRQIIYTSHSATLSSSDELLALLDQSRRANAAAGVTGLLLHADGSIMQVIEGDAAVIAALFERIKRDPRHSGIILICDEPIARRSYGDWSMAFREISPEEAAHLPGFRQKPHDVSARDRDVARNVMQTFLRNAGLGSAHRSEP
jgi:hypothetical protein